MKWTQDLSRDTIRLSCKKSKHLFEIYSIPDKYFILEYKEGKNHVFAKKFPTLSRAMLYAAPCYRQVTFHLK